MCEITREKVSPSAELNNVSRRLTKCHSHTASNFYIGRTDKARKGASKVVCGEITSGTNEATLCAPGVWKRKKNASAGYHAMHRYLPHFTKKKSRVAYFSTRISKNILGGGKSVSWDRKEQKRALLKVYKLRKKCMRDANGEPNERCDSFASTRAYVGCKIRTILQSGNIKNSKLAKWREIKKNGNYNLMKNTFFPRNISLSLSLTFCFLLITTM